MALDDMEEDLSPAIDDEDRKRKKKDKKEKKKHKKEKKRREEVAADDEDDVSPEVEQRFVTIGEDDEFGVSYNDDDDDEPVRPSAVRKKSAAVAKSTPRTPRTPRASGGRGAKAPQAPKDPVEREQWRKEREIERIKKQEIAERAHKKELEIMHGGHFYKMRDEARERERARRDAKKKGREHIERAVRQQEVAILEKRQERIKEIARKFYYGRAPNINYALGEVVNIIPQYNIGYIELLGDESSVPWDLRNDKEFMTGKNARKVLFDGTCLLHQSIMVGDLVKFHYKRLYQGTEVISGGERLRRRDESRWCCTRLELYKEPNLPDKVQMVPQEIRRYMLGLITLLETGKDISLFCKIIQELELWKRILEEEYTNRPHGGLMRWHLLLILTVATRRWLEESNMNIFLWSFFSSFTGTRFITTVLPFLLDQNVLGSGVLLQVMKFAYLYRKHTGRQVNFIESLRKAWAKVMGGSDRPDQSVADEYKAYHDKLLAMPPTEESFVSLLTKATEAGINVTSVSSREQLLHFMSEDYRREMHGEMVDHRGMDPLPTLQELADESSLDPHRLPKNKVEGRWASPEEYAVSSFQLLRADAFKEFQYSMYHKVYHWAEYENSTDIGHKRDIGRPTKFMKLVDVLGVNYLGSTNTGKLCYTIRFRMWEPMQESWIANMMQLGNLVALTTDRFHRDVWWACVAHRDQQLLGQGIVGVEFVRGDPIELHNRLQKLQMRGADKECWLVEATSLFYMGYRPVLDALQSFGKRAQQTGHCPFEDYLVYARPPPKERAMPPWIRNHYEDFLRELNACREENTFDKSQDGAIQGLTQNFLLVQGPPGTGKSYTGVKMVEVILRTRYAILDKLKKGADVESIRDKMTQVKDQIQRYSELQVEVDKIKDEILRLKSQRDNAKDNEHKKKLRRAIDDMLKHRERLKMEMYEIDNRQSALFTEIMDLEQKRQSVLEHFKDDCGPIQIITYKNHSLDEFLMDVKPAMQDKPDDPTKKEGLVRFGTRSLCDELLQYNVNELVKAYEHDPHLDAYRRLLSGALKQKVDELKCLGAEISHLNSGNLTVEAMQCNMTEKQAYHFGEVTEAKIEAWRGQQYNEALISLEDAAKAAAMEEARKHQAAADSEDESEDDGMPRLDVALHRRLFQTKAELDKEEAMRERFIASFSPVLPDVPLPAPVTCSFDPETVDNLDTLSRSQREELARCFVANHKRAVMEQYQRTKNEYIYLLSSLQEFRDQIKVDALQNSQVIGLTTTGCTINKELLNKVKPTILIVEEAAEILESQILSCLNQESIQQVVLVGDHKQLRPIVNNYSLARDCRLDLSLFERMANNKIPVHNLTNQRRMVSQISQFVRPLYAELNDDPCLEPRKMLCETSGEIREPGDVPGLGKPVWFWSHDTPEEKSLVGLSVVNPMEVRMVVWLVKYFTARGISNRQITVLTPYKGQLRELREALESANLSYKDMVCTVDRFQGDENDIMIVSLVRTQKLTEFIKAPDRMCVLLSRARFGMVVLGSSNLLDSPEVEHWRMTMDTLTKNQWIGGAFPCRCDRHPERQRHVTPQDLIKGDAAEVKIENFCQETCRAAFEHCKNKKQHRCTRTCHPGDHVVCDHVCGAKLECSHKCKQHCGECEQRGCRCTEMTEPLDAGCGHYVLRARPSKTRMWEWVPHLQRKSGCKSAFKPCLRYVHRRLPCGHILRLPCFQKPEDVDQCPLCLRGERKHPKSVPDVLDMDPVTVFRKMQTVELYDEDVKAEPLDASSELMDQVMYVPDSVKMEPMDVMSEGASVKREPEDPTHDYPQAKKRRMPVDAKLEPMDEVDVKGEPVEEEVQPKGEPVEEEEVANGEPLAEEDEVEAKREPVEEEEVEAKGEPVEEDENMPVDDA